MIRVIVVYFIGGGGRFKKGVRLTTKQVENYTEKENIFNCYSQKNMIIFAD